MTHVGMEDPVESASTTFDDVVRNLGTREIEVLRRRVFADKPDTLEQLAVRFAVSRERIRQIEVLLLNELRSAHEVNRVRMLIGLVDTKHTRPLAAVLLESPRLADEISALEQPWWRIIERLDKTFEVRDGWWCEPNVATAIRKTRADVVRAAAERRAIRLEDVIELTGMDQSEEWVGYCGFKLHEGFVLVKGFGITDRAAVILEIQGSPLTTEAITDRLGMLRSVRSTKNVLSSDERFTRVDRSSWALASWGLAAYQSIRLLIADEVGKNGGSIRLSKLEADLTSRFSVTKSSVVAYASSLPFRTVDGMVEFAATTNLIPRKTAYETRRLFRVGDSWALRLEISKEHARGSGSTLPTALVGALGLPFGRPTTLVSRMGDQRLGWNSTQLSLGSIKRFVDDDDLAVGATCFAVFGEGRTFDLVRADIPEKIGRARALALAGFSGAGGNYGIPELMKSVGLPVGTSPHLAAERFRLRGDYDISDCILAERW